MKTTYTSTVYTVRKYVYTFTVYLWGHAIRPERNAYMYVRMCVRMSRYARENIMY